MQKSRTLAGLGLGWAAAGVALWADYVVSVPFPENSLVVFLIGMGVTLFYLNHRRE